LGQFSEKSKKITKQDQGRRPGDGRELWLHKPHIHSEVKCICINQPWKPTQGPRAEIPRSSLNDELPTKNRHGRRNCGMVTHKHQQLENPFPITRMIISTTKATPQSKSHPCQPFATISLSSPSVTHQNSRPSKIRKITLKQL
jgi:hypothetical protein